MGVQDIDGCDYFDWIDPEFSGRAKDVIGELSRKKSLVEERLHIVESKLSRKSMKKAKLEKEKKFQFIIFSVIVVILVSMNVMKKTIF